MRITLEQFTYGMGLLAAIHGNGHAVFNNPDIAEIWYEFFATKYSNEKFLQMIKHHLSVCPFFPKVPNDIWKIWLESGDERRPGEGWKLDQGKELLSLPSQEANERDREKLEIENLTPEQMAENRARFNMLYKLACEIKTLNTEDKQSKIEYFTKAPLHELEAIASTIKQSKQLSATADKYGNLKSSPDALFEDMHKYFHSGNDKYRQVAIDWACDPTNGCELVKDANRQVIDIKQVDF